MSGTLMFNNTHLKHNILSNGVAGTMRNNDGQRPCTHGAHGHVEEMERGEIIILIIIS